ncbi:hypothetical protein CEXT_137291 [Caerostris extrusa]|uniref:Endonuclease/exonuclease/phosphatase domain-containing protein n=1 Tax=Caerostris extrusa TaxID=172846 RepID=A0AAV4X6R4_CAEEX|nr:hypothetical protein CEXT_137291 [Caerostris extrusa]
MVVHQNLKLFGVLNHLLSRELGVVIQKEAIATDYTSAYLIMSLKNFSVPDIQRVPVDDVVLQIENCVTFPFPSPPDQDSLKAAERRISLLGALESQKSQINSSSGLNHSNYLTNLLNGSTICIGDLNAKHTVWGSSDNTRGCDLLNLIDDNGFLFLNDGTPTHSSFSYNTRGP